MMHSLFRSFVYRRQFLVSSYVPNLRICCGVAQVSSSATEETWETTDSNKRVLFHLNRRLRDIPSTQPDCRLGLSGRELNSKLPLLARQQRNIILAVVSRQNTLAGRRVFENKLDHQRRSGAVVLDEIGRASCRERV